MTSHNHTQHTLRVTESDDENALDVFVNLFVWYILLDNKIQSPTNEWPVDGSNDSLWDQNSKFDILEKYESNKI